MKIAIILAEFGKPAPDVSQYRECWPDADIQVFSDADVQRIPQFEGPRYGWRMNDYWTVRKALDSGADVAMCFDGDMRIVDQNAAQELPRLARRFGICLPINPRYTVRKDFTDGADTGACIDQTIWNAPSFNCSPVAIGLGGSPPERGGRLMAEMYCEFLLRTPERGPLAWWRAMEYCGVAPLALPPQWCVCEKHIGIGNEIILHEGHDAVKRHYAAHRSS